MKIVGLAAIAILIAAALAGGIRLGGQPIDPYAMHSALGLLACDAGGQCGPDAPQILMNCAYRGQCSANSLYEYSYYYENAPSQRQLVDSYRQALLAMLNARNFSEPTFSPTDVSSGHSVTFSSGPGG